MTDEVTATDDGAHKGGQGGAEAPEQVAPPTVSMTHGADLDSMSASGRRLHARRFDLVALILAVPALWLPGWWLCFALVIYFVVLVYRYVARTVNLDSWGPANFIILPFRAIVGMLIAIPVVLLVALGAVLAMLLGFLAVGVVTGLLGMAFGFILHHDTGDLLYADFKATGIAWGSEFGLFGAAYLMTRQVIRHATGLTGVVDESDESGADESQEVSEHGLVRTLIDQIGEIGLVALVIFSALAVVFFSLFAPVVWRPFGGYRGATGFVHLRSPVESAIKSRIAADTQSTLGGCAAEFTYFDQTVFGSSSTTLKILFQPAAGTSPSADAALIAARITNGVIPVIDFTVITSAGTSSITETLPSSRYRTTVFRSVAAAGAALEPPMPASAAMLALHPLLKNCSASPSS
jgi:hypothetical protein